MKITQDQVTQAVDEVLGRPWKLHGRGPFEFDCLGFMLWMVKRVTDIVLPDPIKDRRAWDNGLSDHFRAVRNEDVPRPLDVLYMRAGRLSLQRLAVVESNDWIATSVEGGSVSRQRLHRLAVDDLWEFHRLLVLEW
jgi:hypothetical protein